MPSRTHACQGQAVAGQGHYLFTVIARGIEVLLSATIYFLYIEDGMERGMDQ